MMPEDKSLLEKFRDLDQYLPQSVRNIGPFTGSAMSAIQGDMQRDLEEKETGVRVMQSERPTAKNWMQFLPKWAQEFQGRAGAHEPSALSEAASWLRARYPRQMSGTSITGHPIEGLGSVVKPGQVGDIVIPRDPSRQAGSFIPEIMEGRALQKEINQGLKGQFDEQFRGLVGERAKVENELESGLPYMQSPLRTEAMKRTGRTALGSYIDFIHDLPDISRNEAFPQGMRMDQVRDFLHGYKKYWENPRDYIRMRYEIGGDPPPDTNWYGPFGIKPPEGK